MQGLIYPENWHLMLPDERASWEFLQEHLTDQKRRNEAELCEATSKCIAQLLAGVEKRLEEQMELAL